MGAPSLDELNAIAGPVLSPDKSLNLGPFVIAMGLDAVLGGILVMQCGAYKSLGQLDPSWVKIMVLYVLIMNVAITLFTWAWIYDLFVYNFGTYGLFLSVKYVRRNFLFQFSVTIADLLFLTHSSHGITYWTQRPSSSSKGFLLSGHGVILSSLDSQLVNNNLLVLIVIGAFALTAFGGGIAVKVMFTAYGSVLHAGDVKVPAYIWLFCTVVADITITVIILYFLFKNRTGWQATDHILARLTRITFESQLPPTLIAIGLATEYTIKYDSFVAIPFICVQAKFYGISLLHTLNGRMNLKQNNPTSEGSGSMQLGSRASKNHQQKSANTNAYFTNSGVKRNVHNQIQVETTFDVVEETTGRQLQLAQGPDRPQHAALGAPLASVEPKIKRQPSDDGLSLDSSSYKAAQDDEERGGAGEYRLENLGGVRRKEAWDDRSKSELPL
ncbi:hypothetical protein FRC10_003449 [Ceratobasidium sp. 414]|nr:hypothetical protein FRC10_003449 [Ceratobasidium sp. 414]